MSINTERQARLEAQRAYVLEQYDPLMVFALQDLEDQLSKGWEFPDACYCAAKKRNLSVETLRRMYHVQEAQS
jgi:hypothetical protein